MPKLLALDMSFTYEAIVQRGLQHSVVCRTLGGFFEHAWSVHPFASLLTSSQWAPRYGPPAVYQVDAHNTFIEGKLGRTRRLAWLPPINFLVAQLGLLRDLRQLVEREQIDVIRVGDPHYLGLFGWLLSRLTGAKLAIRVGANYDVNRARSGQPIQPRLFRSSRLEKFIERFLFERFDLIAGANIDNLEYAIANGAPRRRSTLFRYGNLLDSAHLVSPERRASGIEDLDALGLRPDAFLISVARLEHANALKRPSDTIEVLAAIRARGYDVKLVLAGDGPLRPALEAMVRARGLDGQVVFAGNRDQHWLSRVLPHAAVFVSPHAGRALSEAALAAVPAVGYDIDWQREMLIDGETGYLVEFGDHAALADATAAMLSNRTQAKEFGRALQRHAQEMLDPDELDRHERDVYTQLMSANGFRSAAGAPA